MPRSTRASGKGSERTISIALNTLTGSDVIRGTAPYLTKAEGVDLAR